METDVYQYRTGSTLCTDLTSAATGYVTGREDGLLHVFVPHATAGLALIETGSGTEADLAETLERMLPTQDIYRHRHGSLGHGRDHVMPAIVVPSLTLPVVGGQLALGIWQSVVLVDPNSDNPERNVRFSFLPG
ncbi:MAG: YjbQ family protein [Actinomycetia bacterium]|nr:YjbQ family protein [Actinomycetes bacterium]